MFPAKSWDKACHCAPIIRFLYTGLKVYVKHTWISSMASSTRTLLFACAEDWFFHSHFLPLVKAARRTDETMRIILVTRVGSRREAIERLGVELVPFDFGRGSLHPLSVARRAWRLRKIIRALRPDLVHYIALTPVLMGMLARLHGYRTIMHVTGLGTLAERDSIHFRILRSALFRLFARQVKAEDCSLLFENPDDVLYLRRYGLPPESDIAILGGAGIDPAQFPPLPDPGGDEVRVAFVGRLIASKGVDVLVEAIGMRGLQGKGVRLDIYGEVDSGNPGAYSREQVRAWARLDHVHWHGHTTDIHQVWRRAAICAIPTTTREGMPRAMLEAAAHARPLVVSDVPGCRHFVRDGKEGFVVPPGNPRALAEAIERLASDPELRTRMGQAARRRLFDGFTEEQVIRMVGSIYQKLLRN